MLEHELEVLADTQFRFRWIVKDVERNLVAQTFAMEEGIRGDGRENLIQSVCEAISHRAT
jgi:hypothetical protein